MLPHPHLTGERIDTLTNKRGETRAEPNQKGWDGGAAVEERGQPGSGVGRWWRLEEGQGGGGGGGSREERGGGDVETDWQSRSKVHRQGWLPHGVSPLSSGAGVPCTNKQSPTASLPSHTLPSPSHTTPHSTPSLPPSLSRSLSLSLSPKPSQNPSYELPHPQNLACFFSFTLFIIFSSPRHCFSINSSRQAPFSWLERAAGPTHAEDEGRSRRWRLGKGDRFQVICLHDFLDLPQKGCEGKKTGGARAVHLSIKLVPFPRADNEDETWVFAQTRCNTHRSLSPSWAEKVWGNRQPNLE